MPTAQAAPQSLPSYDEAYGLLLDDVYSTQFFRKLASYGFAPANAAEAQEALHLGRRLRAEEQEQQVKQAQAGQGLFGQANQALDQVYQAHGLVDQTAVKQAAHALTQDPRVFNAVLAVRQEQVNQLMAHQAA